MDLDGDKAGLEATAGVLDKARLLLVGDPRPGDPAEQGQKLATVADTQAEGVGPSVEVLELPPESVVETDDTGPPLGRVQNIGIAETTHRHHPAESIQLDPTAQQIGHDDVPGLEAGGVEGRGHLPVTVAALLAQDGDRDLVAALEDVRVRLAGGQRALRIGAGAMAEARALLLDKLRVGLEPVESEAGLLPEVAEVTHVGGEHLWSPT